MHILNLLKIEIAAILDAFNLSQASELVLSAAERVLAPIFQYNPQVDFALLLCDCGRFFEIFFIVVILMLTILRILICTDGPRNLC
jgi:hypothetical protein